MLFIYILIYLPLRLSFRCSPLLFSLVLIWLVASAGSVTLTSSVMLLSRFNDGLLRTDFIDIEITHVFFASALASVDIGTIFDVITES